MAIIINLDVMMAKRKMSLNDLSEKVDWEYLNSMPYPAHLKDIEYVGENYMSLSKTMGWS